MQLPEIWNRDIWARAARRTLPVEVVDGRRMVSAATTHHADLAGQGVWTVDWLPGRRFDERRARAAMLIAVAPDWPEVDRWAAELGLTPLEARGLVAGVSA